MKTTLIQFIRSLRCSVTISGVLLLFKEKECL